MRIAEFKPERFIVRKKRGEFVSFMIMFVLVFIFMMFSTCLYKQYIAKNTVKKTEESLKAATLAGATMNLVHYAYTGEVIVYDYQNSRLSFYESFAASMDMGTDLTPSDGNCIAGPIRVNEYIIYNVRGSDIEIIAFHNGNAVPVITTAALGHVTAPNGAAITASTVYAEISFEIKGFIDNRTMFGELFHMDNVTVTKASLADIIII